MLGRALVETQLLTEAFSHTDLDISTYFAFEVTVAVGTQTRHEADPHAGISVFFIKKNVHIDVKCSSCTTSLGGPVSMAVSSSSPLVLEAE